MYSIPMHKQIPLNERKCTLIKFGIMLGLPIISANLAVMSLLPHFPHHHYSITVAALNATACVASALGIITVFRYGFHGIHGQSLLFLTLGIIAWFLADLILAYGHFVLHFEEEQSLVVSFADLCWITGYLFLSLHLFSVLRLVRRSEIHALTIVAVTIVCGLSITYNVIFTSEFLNLTDGTLIVGAQLGAYHLELSLRLKVQELAKLATSILQLLLLR